MEVWLYEKLNEKKISQTKLAERTGITKSSLRRKFLGKTPFTYDEVCGICEILDIDNPLPYFPRTKRK